MTIPDMGMRLVLGGMLMVIALGANAADRKPVCAPVATAQDEVTAVMRTMFAALRADDLTGFRAMTTPDFYAYDNGAEFAGDALMKLIQQLHAAGKKFEWSVAEPRVHVSCNLGWITYVNKGAVTDESGRQEVTWLESAVLEYADKRWRIHFLHSSRMPKTPAK
jgi:ketosteroid isomerase-like protein